MTESSHFLEKKLFYFYYILCISSPPPTMSHSFRILFDNIGWSIHFLLILALPMIYLQERSQPMAYSKFASVQEDNEGIKSIQIGSQLGMLIIYLPAVFLCTGFLLYSDFKSNNNLSIVILLMMWVHFWKRTLEVLLLHSYSGRMGIWNAISIGCMYTIYSWCLVFCTNPVSAERNTMWTWFGYTIYTIGLVGNCYHHRLLARLRRPKAGSTMDLDKRYVVPLGGGFSLVAAPHYSFELLIWFGIACVAQHVVAFMVVACMTSYLLARGKNTNDFYRSRFDETEWPKTRKAIIPFIF
jgi:hypothetical protein